MYSAPPDKAIWQKKKKEFHLKDGLTKKVKMGDEFQKYVDDMNKSEKKENKDFAERIPMIDRLHGKVDTYLSAVKKKDKKNAAAIAYLENIQDELDKLKKNLTDIIDSGKTAKAAIAKAKTAYSGFDANTPQATLDAFWRQEMRNIGTVTPLLVQKDKIFSEDHKKFRTAINEVKEILKGDKFNAVNAIALIKKSIVDLESSLDEKGAW